MTLLVVVFGLVLFGGVGYLLGYLSARQQPSGTAALAESDAFIEHLRELCWQNRDIAPELSTILIDEIAQRRRGLPGGPTR